MQDIGDIIGVGVGVGFGIMYLAVIILMVVSHWRIFEKAGQPGWAVLIPIYNVYVYFKIAGKPGWWLLLLLIPLVNIAIVIIVTHEIAKSFGKDVAYTIGLILIGVVFYPLLAFSDAEYLGPGGAPPKVEPVADELI